MPKNEKKWSPKKTVREDSWTSKHEVKEGMPQNCEVLAKAKMQVFLLIKTKAQCWM